jgi:cytosine deaminase
MTQLSALNLNGRTVDVTLDGARIAAVTPSPSPARATILPLPVEPHVHLDKAFTAHRAPRLAPGLFGAIEAMERDKPLWTADDLRARMDQAMAEAHAAGARALRSHVDWTGAAPPLAWEVMGEVAADWRGRLPLHRASLTALDDFADRATACAIAARVAQDGATLGAFIYRHAQIPDRLALIFDLAEAHDLRLDFHVDEGLDPEARAFDRIVAETARRGMGGRVLCGHACSLGIRAADDLARTSETAASAGVALTIQPTANLYLQDMTPNRMPRLRGLAPAQELRSAGVEISLGTDNVRDPFVPFGAFDPLQTLRLAWITGQMDPDDWLPAITEAPARALGLPPNRIAPGEPADFLILPAPSLCEALAHPSLPRQVWRGGQSQTSEPR